MSKEARIFVISAPVTYHLLATKVIFAVGRVAKFSFSHLDNRSCVQFPQLQPLALVRATSSQSVSKSSDKISRLE